jgi:Na+/H+-translocating membrane pyrophosphatase
MKLCECTYGKLVVDLHGRVGMIVGITNNVRSSALQVRQDINKAIPEVSWASGEIYGIHPGNIKVFKS